MTAQSPEDVVPAWPQILAVVRPDGSAEVTINGTSHPVATTSVDDARAAVVNLVRERTAVPLGRPVRVQTREADGAWRLVVHPDGTVQAAEGEPASTGDVTSFLREGRGSAHPESAQPVPVQPDRLPPSVTDPGAAQPGAVQPGAVQPGAVRPGAVQPGPAQPDSVQPDPADPPPADPPPAQPDPAAPDSSSDPLSGRTGRWSPPDSGVRRPTLEDLLVGRPAARPGPARTGWQGGVRRMSGGFVKPRPGTGELAQRSSVASVQRSLDGPKTVVVVNPKGGAHKTTATLLIAATFGIHRGGYVLAWDNNETRGTLGWRANPARHTNTAVTLLRDLDRFTGHGSARVGDLDNYVRSQGSAQFDVLASDEDAASAASIDAAAFDRLHATLARFYRVMVVDTGNNMRASNWQAAVAAADQLVIVSTVREDTAQSAAWLVDALRATGRHGVVNHAVTVLASPSRVPDAKLAGRLRDHFKQLTRVVVEVPYDRSLVDGGPLSYDALSPASREAWLRVAASVADGL